MQCACLLADHPACADRLPPCANHRGNERADHSHAYDRANSRGYADSSAERLTFADRYRHRDRRPERHSRAFGH